MGLSPWVIRDLQSEAGDGSSDCRMLGLSPRAGTTLVVVLAAVLSDGHPFSTCATRIKSGPKDLVGNLIATIGI
ncbi:hypothetical protein GCM10023319_08040 [Nocardia iowensis]